MVDYRLVCAGFLVLGFIIGQIHTRYFKDKCKCKTEE